MSKSKWIHNTHLFRADDFTCSNCRSVSDKPDKVCPSCAAQMRSGNHNPSWVDDAEGLSALLDDDW